LCDYNSKQNSLSLLAIVNFFGLLCYGLSRTFLSCSSHLAKNNKWRVQSNNQVCRHTTSLLKSMPAYLEYSSLFTLQIPCRSELKWSSFLKDKYVHNMEFCSRQYLRSHFPKTHNFRHTWLLHWTLQLSSIMWLAVVCQFVLLNEDI